MDDPLRKLLAGARFRKAGKGDLPAGKIQSLHGAVTATAMQNAHKLRHGGGILVLQLPDKLCFHVKGIRDTDGLIYKILPCGKTVHKINHCSPSETISRKHDTAL